MTRQIALLGLPAAIERDCLRYGEHVPHEGISLHPLSLEALAQIDPSSIDKLAYLATPALHQEVLLWAAHSRFATRPQLLALVPARAEAPRPASPRIEALMSLPSPIHTLLVQLLRLPLESEAIALAQGLSLCPQRRSLIDPADARPPIALTDKEFALLRALLDAAPGSIDRTALMQHVWGHGRTLDTHTLETHIYRLRGKLARCCDAPLIHTDGQGYRFSSPHRHTAG